MHDSLTGLPNRLQLHQHLDRAVARAKRHGHLMAVFGLDLDRFKDVNDTLGHATGDALLAEVSARLKESVREVDLVGRLGGDEFAIVAEDLEAPEDAMRLARRVCTALAEPYHVNGHEVTTSASIGIAIGPLDREAPTCSSRTPTSRSTAPRTTGATLLAIVSSIVGLGQSLNVNHHRRRRGDRRPGRDAEEVGLRPGARLLLRQARSRRAGIGRVDHQTPPRRLVPHPPSFFGFRDPRLDIAGACEWGNLRHRSSPTDSRRFHGRASPGLMVIGK
jgi:diguanylate cyclase (GGDEF)-like protein